MHPQIPYYPWCFGNQVIKKSWRHQWSQWSTEHSPAAEISDSVALLVCLSIQEVLWGKSHMMQWNCSWTLWPARWPWGPQQACLQHTRNSVPFCVQGSTQTGLCGCLCHHSVCDTRLLSERHLKREHIVFTLCFMCVCFCMSFPIWRYCDVV